MVFIFELVWFGTDVAQNHHGDTMCTESQILYKCFRVTTTQGPRDPLRTTVSPRAYLIAAEGLTWSVAKLKKHAMWLHRAVRLHETVSADGSHDTYFMDGGLLGRSRRNWGTTVPHRKRNRVLQSSAGRKYKCPVFREALWAWFIDNRASVRTHISARFFSCKQFVWLTFVSWKCLQGIILYRCRFLLLST